MLKKIIILLFKMFIWTLLHVFYICPLNKKRFYFSSFLGHQYSCNPKYLYEYLLANYKDYYSYVWEFVDVSKSNLVPDAKTVKAKTIKAIFFCMTSKYIIYNTEFPWYIPLRKKQFLLQTWHGGGAYKKVGVSASWDKLTNINQRLNSKQISFYVSSSQKFTEVQSVSKCVPEYKFLKCGMPRNSFLLKNDETVRNMIIEKLGINPSLKVLLYAPTYRGKPTFSQDGSSETDMIDYSLLQKSLQERFGGEWLIMYRGHYYDYHKNESDSSDYMNVTKYEDMQELLYITDILITDYSSSMWDFSLTGKPVFLFAPDIDTYDIERGFYTNPYSWPFLIAKSNESLCENIKTFSNQSYSEEIKKHHEMFVSYENANSCELILAALGVSF